MAKYAPLSPPIQGMPISGPDQREVKTLPGYQDEWDLLQENLEASGMFPFAPGLGDAASELGDLILYSASGKGRDGIDRVNDLDRFVTLPQTWAGQAAQEFGGLLQMTPEQLVQLRRSLGSLLSGDAEAKAALWEGVKQSASGYDKDPMSLVEDVGPVNPAIGVAAAGKAMGKGRSLISGLGKQKPATEYIKKINPKTPSAPMGLTETQIERKAGQAPQLVAWDVDNIDDDQWNSFVHADDPDAIKLDVDEDFISELQTADAAQEFGQYVDNLKEFGQDVAKIKVPDEVKKALDAEDALGFSTSNEAAKEILMHPDWDGRWEIVSEDNKKIIKNWVDSLKAEGKIPTKNMPDAGEDPAMVQKGGDIETPEFDTNLLSGNPSEDDIKLIKKAALSVTKKSDADLQKNIDTLHNKLVYYKDNDEYHRNVSLLNVHIKERANRMSDGSWSL